MNENFFVVHSSVYETVTSFMRRAIYESIFEVFVYKITFKTKTFSYKNSTSSSRHVVARPRHSKF